MKRILIVDDEPNVRLNYRITLEVEGHQVVETGSATEALKRLKLGKFDLAILDLHMPSMDRPMVARALRERSHTQDMPILVLASYRDRELVAEARTLAAGFSPHQDRLLDLCAWLAG